MASRFGIAAPLSVALLILSGCSHADNQGQKQGAPAGSAPSSSVAEQEASVDTRLAAYPPGRWRFASPAELSNVVIGTSDILIRYAGADRLVPGSVAPWRLEPSPSRSRRDALVLAQKVATELAKDPSQFAQLARQYSEDTTTNSRGGAQGAGRATDFSREPEVLDALSVLAPGQVSGVIETSHGFQIVRRERLPPPAKVTGRHIVISHEDTQWFSLVGEHPPTRSRAEALALATSIWQEAMAKPGDFAALVARYSEHPDRVDGGDMGTWSVREPTHYPRGVDALRELSMGAVHLPIESHLGFEIVQRTEDRARPTYSMEAIKLAFQPGDETSRQDALQRANQVLGALAEAPSRFDEFRRQYCCAGFERWVDGRAEPGLTPVVSSLAIDHVSTTPAIQYLNIVIPKRTDPALLPPEPPVLYELPSPDRPKLLWGLARLPTGLVVHEMQALLDQRVSPLELSPIERAGVHQAASDLESGGQRGDVSLLSRFESLLGREKAGLFVKRLEQRLGDLMLGVAPAQ